MPVALLSDWDIEARLRELNSCIPASTPTAPTLSLYDDEAMASACSEYGSYSMASQGMPLAPPTLYKGALAVRLNRMAEEGMERIPDVLPPDPPMSVAVRPSSAFIEGRATVTCVRDASGEVVLWPWELGATAVNSASHALPRQSLLPHRTDALRLKGMNASMASGDMGRGSTGVSHWKRFCATEGTPHDRPVDPASPLWVKLEEELLAMQFCCALVQDRGVQASTAACYFGQVQGWLSKEHGIKLAAGMKLARLPAMLKGLRRVLAEAPRAVRRGIAPQMLRRAMDLLLDPADPACANIRAALAVALQGMLRSAEFACDPGVKFNPVKHLTRADIVACSSERLVLMMLPCKNMRHLSGKTVPLVIGSGGEYVDAVAEVRNMLLVDPVDPSMAASTPLFRVPSTGEPLRTNMLRDLIRSMMGAVEESDPNECGTHSLRIGGATALFAAGADETVIRTMGRWSSDCYRLYVRACFQSTLKWSRLAGSTVVHDLAGEFDEVDFY